MNKIKTLVLTDKRTLTIILSTLSFLIPFSLAQPQLLVGTLVNAAIILAAIYLPFNLTFPILILPILAVMLRGLIFGPFTYLLVLYLPFIWVGNYLLFLIFRRTYQEKKLNYSLSLLISSLIKALFLFSLTLVLFNLKIVPKIFLQTMGWLQLVTALFGGGIVFFLRR